MDGEKKHTLLERLSGRSDMGPVLRIAGWGLAAVAALAIAIIASRSDIGQRRATAALNPLQNEATRLALTQAFTRADEAERGLRKLSETVQTLGADRDKLLNRVASLERSLEDLTGSIALTQPARRPAIVDLLMPPGTRPAEPAQQPGPPATEGADARQAGLGQPPAQIEAPISLAPNDVAAGEPRSIPIPRIDPRKTRQFAAHQAGPAPIMPPSHMPPSRMAAGEPPASDVPATPRDGAAMAPAASGTRLGGAAASNSHGVDLGSATSIEGLRALWKKIRKGRGSALLGDLKPVVSVHDADQPGSVELRLVAGPVPSALAASRLCGALSAAGTPCRATTFDGQSLAAR